MAKKAPAKTRKTAPKKSRKRAVTNYQNEVGAMAAKYPNEWRNAHSGNAQTEDFIRLLAAHLHATDPNCGLNGKRGNPDDISDDVIAIYDESGDVVDRTGKRMHIIDCIGGAGGPNPTPAWASVGGPSPGAWVKPTAVVPSPGPTPGPTPKPCPDPSAHQPKPAPAYPGDVFGAQIGAALFADYAKASNPPNDGMGVWFFRVAWDASHGLSVQDAIAKHRAEWRAQLGLS